MPGILCQSGSQCPRHTQHQYVNLLSSGYLLLFVFKDDDLVNEKYLSGIVHMVGGTGVVNLKKNANTWTGTRDIVLTD